MKDSAASCGTWVKRILFLQDFILKTGLNHRFKGSFQGMFSKIKKEEPNVKNGNFYTHSINETRIDHFIHFCSKGSLKIKTIPRLHSSGARISILCLRYHEYLRVLGAKRRHTMPSSLKESQTLNSIKRDIKSCNFECNCRLWKQFVSNLGFLLL